MRAGPAVASSSLSCKRDLGKFSSTAPAVYAQTGPACRHVATVLLLRGSLKLGAHLIAGTTHAKVRVMTDSTGSPAKVAGPGMAVTVSGWKELPGAGDEVLEGSEQDIKKAVANRLRTAEEQAMMIDIDAINTQRRLDREQKEREEADLPETTPEAVKVHELRLVIKGDVSGSVEALVGAVQCIGNESAGVKIICTGVGEITETDIQLAKTSESEFSFSGSHSTNLSHRDLKFF
jgi:translation initiation factor IF-2